MKQISFPEYKMEFYIAADGSTKTRNMYKEIDVGFGGYVYAEQGMYTDVALLDVAGMHPHSIINMNYFGEYTPRYKALYDARLAIKRNDTETAKKLLGHNSDKYLSSKESLDSLSYALKIAANSAYGLTSAHFSNPMLHPMNKNNIVALRGALFMVDLRFAIQEKGFDVCHIKTDSVKVPDATPSIIQFIIDFGKKYGYTFEHEATYDRMCLVNDAVYIARYKDCGWCEKTYGYLPGDNKKHPGEWTATGTQFAVPYVFKKLFSKEDIAFEDMCETKSVNSALYLDMNEGLPEGEHNYRFIGKVGQFCPIKESCGGGILFRETINKQTGEKGYAAAAGSKGYRWLESEMVRELGKEDDIDISYYDKMVDEAVKSISEYGDFERFVSDEPYISKGLPWNMPCGKSDCQGCEHWKKTQLINGKLICEAGCECLPF